MIEAKEEAALGLVICDHCRKIRKNVGTMGSFCTGRALVLRCIETMPI